MSTQKLVWVSHSSSLALPRGKAKMNKDLTKMGPLPGAEERIKML